MHGFVSSHRTRSRSRPQKQQQVEYVFQKEQTCSISKALCILQIYIHSSKQYANKTPSRQTEKENKMET